MLGFAVANIALYHFAIQKLIDTNALQQVIECFATIMHPRFIRHTNQRIEPYVRQDHDGVCQFAGICRLNGTIVNPLLQDWLDELWSNNLIELGNLHCQKARIIQ